MKLQFFVTVVSKELGRFEIGEFEYTYNPAKGEIMEDVNKVLTNIFFQSGVVYDFAFITFPN